MAGAVGTVDEGEVKGLWFASARAYLLDEFGVEALDGVTAAMGEHADILREPDHNLWYPEAALAEMLAAMDEVLCDGDEERFIEVIVGASTQGIGRFFRLLMGLGSTRFLLKKVPTLFHWIRRSNARVEVDSSPERSLIHYRDFPWLEDHRYRLMTVGTLRGMIEISTGKTPEIRIVDQGPSHLSVEVLHP